MKTNRIQLFKILSILTIALISSAQSNAQQKPDSLQIYLDMAVKNNPAVRAGYLNYQASLQQLSQAGAYADPKLDAGFYPRPMNIVDGKEVADFRIMQMFPWFGSKGAAKREASYRASMENEKYQSVKNNLYLNLYTVWYTLCNLQQQLGITQKELELLTRLQQLTLRKYEAVDQNATMTGQLASSQQKPTMVQTKTKNSGTGINPKGGKGLSELFRIEMRINELENNIHTILNSIAIQKVKFNSLLNRPMETEVNIPDHFSQTPFIFDMELLTSLLVEHNPNLKIIDREQKALEAKKVKDRKAGLPKWGVGIDYMLVGKDMNRMGSMSSMNGMDMVMPMVSVSIPLYRNKYKAQQRQTNYLIESNRAQYSNTLNNLKATLYAARQELDNAAQKIQLYREQTQAAQATYSLLLKGFVTGTNSLTDLIDIEQQLLGYQLKMSEATASYNSMVAGIENLISYTNK